MEPIHGPRSAAIWQQAAEQVEAQLKAKIADIFADLPDVAPWRVWVADKLMDLADRIYR